MKTLYLGENAEDLTILGSKFVEVDGVEDVRQRILVALRHHNQEYFLNIPNGVPYYNLILGSKNKKLTEQIIRSAVLDVIGVVSIGSMDVSIPSPRSRQIEIFMSVEVLAVTGTASIEIREIFP